jgi:hypothetical protein
VRLFLEKDLLPALGGGDARLKFQALVAANVLSIAGRELASEEQQLIEERDLLRPLVNEPTEATPGVSGLREMVGQMNEELCGRIRHGELDDPDKQKDLTKVLRRLVMRKLEIASPRYLTSK